MADEMYPSREPTPLTELERQNSVLGGKLESLKDMHDIPITALPPPYKRKPISRIYAVRAVDFKSVEYVGFDMDYTLAVYKSPAYEAMVYDLILTTLIKRGYEPSLRVLQYDEKYIIRGLLVDTHLGNFIKVDAYGNILLGTHGSRVLSRTELLAIYPDEAISSEYVGMTKRFRLVDTYFDVPVACLYGHLIQYYEDQAVDHTSLENVRTASMELNFELMWQDVRAATELVHRGSEMREKTLADLDKYVRKDAKLERLLTTLRQREKKTFLLTNSHYDFSNAIMTYLLGDKWKSFFDIAIVAASKPSFFSGSAPLREVNTTTGQIVIGKKVTAFECASNAVYSGGSLKVFTDLIGGVTGARVLYCGDHIFGDILTSKKVVGWRTLFVAEELRHEVNCLEKTAGLFTHLANLEYYKAQLFQSMDAESLEPPDISNVKDAIDATVKTIDEVFNPLFGSLFRNGFSRSYFSYQMMRYADLYTHNVTNILNYPYFYQFIPESGLQVLPHERPVA
jgi:5'-nucleotidase